MNPIRWLRDVWKARRARRWLRDWYHDEGMLAINGCRHCEEVPDE